mmetsp:Transcript_91871/g.279115  ORF Transcript_91871/g.279115 Transcript_91871/m.279115 type:complete len:180 (+) Transcript_91871:469-1008(+)
MRTSGRVLRSSVAVSCVSGALAASTTTWLPKESSQQPRSLSGGTPPAGAGAAAAAPAPAGGVPPERLLGCWLDSFGSQVVVEAASAPLTQLTATLLRRTRPDVRMSLWQTPDASGWYCGEAKLVEEGCSGETLVWAFPDGRVSEWQWQAFTLEALAVRGLASPHELGVPAVLVPLEDCY